MTVTVSAVGLWGPAPQVRLEVSSSPAVRASMAVWRNHGDGRRFRVLSTLPPILNGTWLGVDYHLPFNAPVTYSVEVDGQTGQSPLVVLPSRRSWLIHPSDPKLSMRLAMVLGPAPARVRKSRAVSEQVLGRAEPTSVPVGRRLAESGQMTVWCESVAEMDRLDALLDDDGPVLVNNPSDDRPWKWVQPTDTSFEVPTGRTMDRYRQVVFPYFECSPPDADLVPQFTLGDLARKCATIGDIAARYADLRGIALDLPK